MNDRNVQMVLQVLADSLGVNHGLDAQPAEMLGIANARQLQKLR